MSLTPAAKWLLSRPERFSRHVLGMPLYAYQAPPLRAVAASVLRRQGREFLLLFPRQSGKNEVVAHLLVYLLNLLQRRGGNIVYGAVGDGLGRGVRRLEARLENPWNRGRWGRGTRPLRRTLGRVAVVFLSTHPQAFSRGETAHWLLVVDELQDQDASHLEAVFEPMRAATNASALYLGTARFRHDALWRKKEALERLQAEDGVQRVWQATPDAVGDANPAYAAFLRKQVRRLGRDHPIIQSEYYLNPLDVDGGLFPPRRRALMQGDHPRQRAPQPGAHYVATLDVGGQDEAAPGTTLANPGRDYTVCTVFAVGAPAGAAPGPTYRAVDVFVDQGSRHFQPTLLEPALADRLLAYLQSWRVAHVVADASGVGAGLADWLAAALGGNVVTRFTFTAAAKARLGNHFLSLVETGRFRYWTGDAETPLSDGWWFWQQAARCSYSVPPGANLERQMRWGVPDGATLDTPAGRQPVHDDRLISAALIAAYDAARVVTGPGDALVVPPADPLAHLAF